MMINEKKISEHFRTFALKIVFLEPYCNDLTEIDKVEQFLSLSK